LLESDIRPDIAIEDVSEITAALRAISGF